MSATFWWWVAFAEAFLVVFFAWRERLVDRQFWRLSSSFDTLRETADRVIDQNRKLDEENQRLHNENEVLAELVRKFNEVAWEQLERNGVKR